MKRGDFIVIGIIIFIAGGIFFATGKSVSSSDTIAVVMVDGKEYGRYYLEDMKQEVVEIKTEYGRNVLHFEDGSVHIHEADCNDKTCLKMGSISKPGEMIICLPNRLLIEVISNDSEELDMMLK